MHFIDLLTTLGRVFRFRTYFHNDTMEMPGPADRRRFLPKVSLLKGSEEPNHPHFLASVGNRSGASCRLAASINRFL